ncbi:peptide chain release factor N(5)-glutamine methyltransferase [Flavobacteriaceae bacterium Ap0902]|nr:peptide chain release factor N(5)-glutamine methyltransferase [Flavobacteriaceae bacterium Ap0902]
MTIRDIKNQFLDRLQDLYTKEEIDTIFFILAEKFLHKDKSIIRAGLDESWSELESAEKHFDYALHQLTLGAPYQYIVGETEFLDYKIFVNPAVLIPRPETEELVEWIKEDYTNPDNEFNGSILDIGTGSGAIAIALKDAFPNASVHALDISQKALEVAQNNAMYNHTNITFHKINILKSDLKDLPHFDIIVSNPPYIPLSEKQDMDDNVTQFEPAEALFVPDENPTEFYFQISQLAQDKLRPRGSVYLEIHQNLMEKTKEIYDMGFGRVSVKKDISDNWRLLRAEQPYTCG